MHDHRPKHEAQADLTHKLKLTQNNEHSNHSELNFKVFINATIVYIKQPFKSKKLLSVKPKLKSAIGVD